VAIDPKRTAIVLIEFQNDFTSEGARSTAPSRT
jgi:nicotinamidase-related amidase